MSIVKLNEIASEWHNAKLYRGERNNNPGNLVDTPQVWQGEIVVNKTDDKFMQFTSAIYGIRALVRLLLNYEAKYGLNTIEKIIPRYAPRNENDTEAYIVSVCKHLKVLRNEVISVRACARLLVEAIIHVECGGRIIYTDQTIDSGIALALGKKIYEDDQPKGSGESKTYLFCGAMQAMPRINSEGTQGYDVSLRGEYFGWMSKPLFEKFALYLNAAGGNAVTFCEVAAILDERKSVRIGTAMVTHCKLKSCYDLVAAAPQPCLSEADELASVDSANHIAEAKMLEHLEFVLAWGLNGMGGNDG